MTMREFYSFLIRKALPLVRQDQLPEIRIRAFRLVSKLQLERREFA